jgi:SAM-dependent methyltransferase
LGSTRSDRIENDAIRANHAMYDNVEARIVVYFHQMRGHLNARFLDTLRILREFGNGGTRYLEVGSNIGFATSIARRGGFDVHACELNDSCREASRAIFGFPVDRDFLEMDGVFDFIVMCDVLEHFPDPLAALEHAFRLLASGGILFVQLPNHEGVQARKAGLHWKFLCVPDHTFHFTRDSLSSLAARVGFEPVWSRTVGFIDEKPLWNILPGPIRRTILRHLNAFEPIGFVPEKGTRGTLLQMVLRKG